MAEESAGIRWCLCAGSGRALTKVSKESLDQKPGLVSMFSCKIVFLCIMKTTLLFMVIKLYGAKLTKQNERVGDGKGPNFLSISCFTFSFTI